MVVQLHRTVNFVLTLALAALLQCARLVGSSEIRETLEFRLVHSSSTYRVNRDAQDSFRRLVSIHRQDASTEADLNRELNRVEKNAALGKGQLFLAWNGSGERAHPHEFVVLGPPLMNCEDLAAAEPRQTGGFGGLVYLRFTEEGARRMRTITAEHIGGQLAIVWRKRVVAAPTIEQAIPNGRAVISNIQTVHEAQLIARTIAACIPARRSASR